MILVDTSIWIEHLRRGLPGLAARLDAGRVLGHPMVIGELALGTLRERAVVLASLRMLPMASVATTDEVLAFIERYRLFGLGIGYIDAHLLAATHLSPDARLWTGDRRLKAAAARLGVAVS